MSDTILDEKKKHKGGNIDGIPDDIIVCILSLLPLKDAVATSVLSSRWRYLWRSAIMSLNFDVDRVIPKYGRLTDPQVHVKEYLNKRRKSYIRWVNKVVDQHSGAINSLRVCYYLRRRHTKHIDRWIIFALRSNILERLELDFSEQPTCRLPLPPHQYMFFPNLFRVKYVGFKSLKVLSLMHLSVSEEEIDYLLSNAPLLERLALQECLQNLFRLRVSGQSLALKHLEIRNLSACLHSVEICDLVNLVSFFFHGQTLENNADDYILRNLPLLVDFHIDPLRNPPSLFSCCLPQIEFLRITEYPKMMMLNYDGTYPVLPNVKQVHLTLMYERIRDLCGGFSKLRTIIETFPNLERLEIHVPTYFAFYNNKYRDRDWPAEVPNCPHYRLKEVEVFNYDNEVGDMERILYLIKHAVALEKIIVNCKFDPPLRRLKTKEQIFKAEQIATIHAMTQLKPQIPSHIEFICRSHI